MKIGKRGFTLVEIMIVAAIIGLLAAIAVLNFVRVRTRTQQNACIANLKQVDGAKQVWAFDNGKADTDTPDWAALVPNYIKDTPTCPGGGAYTIAAVNADPTCDKSGHAL